VYGEGTGMEVVLIVLIERLIDRISFVNVVYVEVLILFLARYRTVAYVLYLYVCACGRVQTRTQ